MRAGAARPLSARPLRPGVWRVTSSRPGEEPYTTHWYGARGTCTCPGFVRWGQSCKHLDLVRQLAGPLPAIEREDRMQDQPPPRALARVPVPAPPAIQEPSRALTNLSVQEVSRMADMLSQAQGFLPKGITQPAQVFAVILTGQEIGIGPMAALRHIPMVEGKPDPSAELLLALIRHQYGPQTIRVAESTAEHCTVEWIQPGWPGVQAFTWTRADSERAGLAGKDNHRKYPAAMNRARALKHVARMAFPEVALGLDLGGDEERAEAPPPRARANGDPREVARERLERTPAGEGLLTADELQPGGRHTGERGGILEDAGAIASREQEDYAVGEVVGLTECASCGTVAECVFDGEAYICADQAACSARSHAELRPDAAQASMPLALPDAPADDPTRASAKQVESIRAHLQRTGKSEDAIVEELGHPLARLTRDDASKLLRDLAKLPNAPAFAVDEGEAL